MRDNQTKQGIAPMPTPVAPTVQATIAETPFVAIAATPGAPFVTPSPSAVASDPEALAHTISAESVRYDGVPELAPNIVVAGRYRLEREIGKGATAAVWQATDLKLKRAIALKAFAVRDVRGATAANVAREAQESGRVRSEFVVAIHDACIDEALGIAAMDMELCVEFARDSTPRFARELAKHVAEKPSLADMREAARWVMQAATGVQAAHTQNVFHRDLKPANILVSAVRRRAQVADFGLAAYKIAPAFGEADTGPRQTMSTSNAEGHILAGTPAYMAPEQARGMPFFDPRREADRRALVAIDIYGLGAVLYELLAGKPPHDMPDECPVIAVIVKATLNEVDFDVLRKRGVPARLVWIARCAMETNPEDRYSSSDDMAAALQAYLDNRPFAAKPRRADSRALLAARRHPGLVGSVALSGAVLFATLTSSAWRLDAANAQLASSRSSLDNLASQINESRDTITKLNADREHDAREAEGKAKDAAAHAESNAAQLRAQAASASGKADRERLLREARESDLKAEKEHEKELQARQDAELAQVKSAQASEIANLQLKQQTEIQNMRSGQQAEINNLKKEHAAEVLHLEEQQRLTIKHLTEQHETSVAAKDRKIEELEEQIKQLHLQQHAQRPHEEREAGREEPPSPRNAADQRF